MDLILIFFLALIESGRYRSHLPYCCNTFFSLNHLQDVMVLTSFIVVYYAAAGRLLSAGMLVVVGAVAIHLVTYAWSVKRYGPGRRISESGWTDEVELRARNNPGSVLYESIVTKVQRASKKLPVAEGLRCFGSDSPFPDPDKKFASVQKPKPVVDANENAESRAGTDGTREIDLIRKIEEEPSLSCRSIEAPHLGTLRIIELHRPRAKNAISKQLLQEFETEIDQIHYRSGTNQVRCLIISSSLNDAFCAGADLKERRAMTIEETQDFLAQLRRAFAKLACLPVPSICCISGLALGGGLELAICCHFRIFSDNAIVGLPETKLAIIPGAGGTFRLQELIGASNARDMILTGRRVRAAEAFRMGLCNRLIETNGESPDDLERLRDLTLEAGLSLAREVAAGGPVAVRAAVGAIAGASEEAENTAYDVVLTTHDRAQALEYFGKPHPPAFKGK